MNDWSERLDALPRLSLIEEATPLHRAKNLRAGFGGPDLWLKRDDLLPAGFGGNKMRSLDVVGADVLLRSANVIVTGAGVLSNHVRAVAAVAAMTGLRCEIAYWGPPPARIEGNHLLTRMLGANISFTGENDRASVDAAIARMLSMLRAMGENPYGIPRGGACALAALSHVLAVRETVHQLARLDVRPDAVLMAVGGGATLAGWLLGSALFGASWRIDAVTVSRPVGEAMERAENLAIEAAALIGCNFSPGCVEAVVHDGFIGEGYGVPSKAGQEAIASAARTEGIFLDPVYTGKAMACYRALIEKGYFDDAATALFLHTGGAPGLFTASVERML
ncbi:MAG: pyridoxal-phosphate dependent enzyme [Methylocystis sp.]